MDVSEYQRMYDSEDRSWWFRGRRRIVASVLESLKLQPAAKLADIGCGTGGNLPTLAQFGRVTAVEPSPDARAFALSRKAADVVEGTAEATGLPDESFDVVTLLDVLEHLDEEAPALGEISRVLKPGGRLLLTVPAFMFLWSAHDEALHHRRRYRRGELKDVLKAAGFEIEQLTYYNAGLFPPVAAMRVGRRLIGGGKREADGAEMSIKVVNTAFEALFAAERHLLSRRIRLPFGVSLLAVARRR